VTWGIDLGCLAFYPLLDHHLLVVIHETIGINGLCRLHWKMSLNGSQLLWGPGRRHWMVKYLLLLMMNRQWLLLVLGQERDLVMDLFSSHFKMG
jgi:hypothetical protein